MAWLIYIIGVLLSLYLWYIIMLKEEGEIKLGHAVTFILISFGSWISLFIVIIYYIDDNKDKVIYKSKNKKDGLGKNN